MLLPQTSQYALRAMACLAATGPDSALNSRELSDATSIPHRYLSKVMRALVVAELVTSRKGHHGGFALARTPEDIRYTEILTAVGFAVDPTDCAFGFAACDEKKPCPLHESWKELKELCRTWAAGTSLASTIRNSGADEGPISPSS